MILNSSLMLPMVVVEICTSQRTMAVSSNSIKNNHKQVSKPHRRVRVYLWNSQIKHAPQVHKRFQLQCIIHLMAQAETPMSSLIAVEWCKITTQREHRKCFSTPYATTKSSSTLTGLQNKQSSNSLTLHQVENANALNSNPGTQKRSKSWWNLLPTGKTNKLKGFQRLSTRGTNSFQIGKLKIQVLIRMLKSFLLLGLKKNSQIKVKMRNSHK